MAIEPYNKNIHVLVCPKCGKYISKKLHRSAKTGLFKCYAKVDGAPCNWSGKTPKYRRTLSPFGITPKNPLTTAEFSRWDSIRIIRALDLNAASIKKRKPADVRDRALISFLYLTGARISEVCGLRHTGGKNYVVPPITKGQVEFFEKFGVPVINIKDMAILKRRPGVFKDSYGALRFDYPIRTIAIPIHHEPEHVNYIKEWYLGLPVDDSIPLFKMTESYAAKVLRKILNLYPHALRHIRMQDLVRKYGMTDSQLMRYVGWASNQMASRYIHLSSDDLLKNMLTSYAIQKKVLSGEIKDEVKEEEVDVFKDIEYIQ